MISSGDADSSRAEGFRSLVLLDEGFAAGAAFGVDGTPMAVLLGADGRVASSVAAGAERGARARALTPMSLDRVDGLNC